MKPAATLGAVTASLLLACCDAPPVAHDPAAPSGPVGNGYPAAALDPQPAPGNWTLTVIDPSGKARSAVICLDLEVAQAVGPFIRAPADRGDCRDVFTPQADGGFAYATTCKGMTRTGTLRGDLSKIYTVNATDAQGVTRFFAVREGECQPGMNPGDMVEAGYPRNIMGRPLGGRPPLQSQPSP